MIKVLSNTNVYWYSWIWIKNNGFSIFNHSHSIQILPFLWWNASLATTTARPAIIWINLCHFRSWFMENSVILSVCNSICRWIVFVFSHHCNSALFYFVEYEHALRFYCQDVLWIVVTIMNFNYLCISYGQQQCLRWPSSRSFHGT